LVFFVQPNSIRDSQNIKDTGSVTIRWDVMENTCGYKALKLIKIIDENAIIINSSVLFSVLFNVNFTSVFIEFKISSITFFNGFLNFHSFLLNKAGIIIRIIHDNENRAVLGSNTENRFVIILK